MAFPSLVLSFLISKRTPVPNRERRTQEEEKRSNQPDQPMPQVCAFFLPPSSIFLFFPSLFFPQIAVVATTYYSSCRQRVQPVQHPVTCSQLVTYLQSSKSLNGMDGGLQESQWRTWIQLYGRKYPNWLTEYL